MRDYRCGIEFACSSKNDAKLESQERLKNVRDDCRGLGEKVLLRNMLYSFLNIFFACIPL